jgi:hypothetical protein
MGKISKTFALLLTITIAMSSLTLLTVKPANAQSIPKPSIPQFTVKYADHSYYVPSTYATDQSTGKNVTINGYYVANVSFELTITNQTFSPYKDANGHSYNLYFNIRAKLHSEDSFSIVNGGVEASKTTEPLDPGAQETVDFEFTRNLPASVASNDLAVDIQAQSQIGYYELTQTGQNVFVGETSGWSPTQTIIIPSALSASDSPTPTQSLSPSPNPTFSPTPTPTSTITPSVPELTWFAIVPLLLSMFTVALIVRYRKPTLVKKL